MNIISRCEFYIFKFYFINSFGMCVLSFLFIVFDYIYIYILSIFKDIFNSLTA